MTPIAPHITAFLRERLPIERRASEHTCGMGIGVSVPVLPPIAAAIASVDQNTVNCGVSEVFDVISPI